MVATKSPGDKAEIVVIREGREKTIRVDIGERPAQASARYMGGSSQSDRLGSRSRADRELKDRYSIEADEEW